MNDITLNLKKLNIAYIAALEWDYCPDADQYKEVQEYIGEIDIPVSEIENALNENQGRRPDEIALSISDLIKTI